MTETANGTDPAPRLKRPAPAPSPLHHRLADLQQAAGEALALAQEFGSGQVTAALYGVLQETRTAQEALTRATALPAPAAGVCPHPGGLVRRRRVRGEDDGRGGVREVRDVVDWCPACGEVRVVSGDGER